MINNLLVYLESGIMILVSYVCSPDSDIAWSIQLNVIQIKSKVNTNLVTSTNFGTYYNFKMY